MESDQTKRLFLAMAIMIPMAFLFSWFSQRQGGQGTEQAATDAGAPAVAQAPAQPPVSPEIKPAQPGQPEEPPAEVKQITLEREEATLIFSTRGGALISAVQKGKKAREQTTLGALEGFKRVFSGEGVVETPQMDLAVPVDDAAGDSPLAVAIKAPRGVPANAVYRVGEQADPDAVQFTLRQNGWEIDKQMRWAKDGRDFAMTVRVKNVGAEATAGELQVSYARGVEPDKEEAGSYFGGVGNQSNVACLVDDSLERVPPNEDPPVTKQGKVWFLAIDQQYFTGAVYPMDGPMDGRCEALSASLPSSNGKMTRRASGFFPLSLGPGEERVFRFAGFVGPKDLDLLAKSPERMAALGMKPVGEASFGVSAYPHLDKMVDYGVWAAICRVLLGILKFFHGFSGNWGVAIILLTLMVKLALVPLSIKAMAGAEAMKKLQPKMEEIRKKYAEDRERQQMETMKLYQEAKVNPVGGCLPMLVQIPIWIALFTTLRTSYELYREPFISPVWGDLTFRDPTYFFPIAMGVTWVFTQRAQPQMVDPIQAKLLTYVMPIFFTITMLNYPMGLSLYIATNNVLTNLQQWILKKFMAQKGTPADAASGAPQKPGEKNERDAAKSRGRKQRAT